MSDKDSKLGSRAFGEHTDPGLVISCQSHQDALQFLAVELDGPNGIALLQGPKGSGKSVIAKEQRAWAGCGAAVALLDGAHLTPRRLSAGLLSQFSVPCSSEQDEHQLQALNRFLSAQAMSGSAPVLILDNADRATPSALRLLNWLAALEARGNYALRIILLGKEPVTTLVRQDGMRNLARRKPKTFSLNPLTEQETVNYLRTRFIAAGGKNADSVFSIEVCEKLRTLSDGWPGPLNALALKAMERMGNIESTRAVPRITVSREGRKVAEYELTERQYVIGRTELADILIEDSYASKMHAMLQVYSNAVVLVDLNSTNGTTVNSRVIEKTILRDNDVISLGHYRLKIEDVPAMSAELDERIKMSDTITMQNLDDMRRTRARRMIKALNKKQENN